MSLFPPTFNTLQDLYINELRDLYSAKTQLIVALPKMADAASDPALGEAFTSHLEETRQHAQRLEEIFSNLPEEATGETCQAMKGLIKESEEYVSAGGNSDVRDAGIIGAAQRVEHYEIAGYGTARALAQRLGDTVAVKLLDLTIKEEGAADHKLTEIAEQRVNAAATIG